MSTREEYLQKLEENLLDKLTESYKALNKNLILLYSLLLLLLLFASGILTKIRFEEAEPELTPEQWLLLTSALIIVPYLLVNNAVNQISRIVTRLKANSTELIQLNPTARPFLPADLEIYSQGIAGIQYQLAYWVVKYFLNKEILHLAFEIPAERNKRSLIEFSLKLPLYLVGWVNKAGWRIIQALGWILVLVVLYIVPLIITMAIIVNKEFYPNWVATKYHALLSLNFGLILLMVIMLVSTFVSNWHLCSFYFVELADLKTELRVAAMPSVVAGPLKILKFYLPENQTVNTWINEINTKVSVEGAGKKAS